MTQLQVETQGARVRSFVNLREFARTSSSPHVVVTGDAGIGANGRRLMPATQDTVQIGSIELDSARGAVRFQPADEFIFVASGEITLTQGAARHRLSAGDSAVLQHGCSFDWSDEVRSTLIFMRYLASQVGTKQVLPIDRSEPSGHSNGPPKELLTSPTPTCWSNTAHTSSDKAFSCGIWISTPFQRRPMFYRYYELMHIVTGERNVRGWSWPPRNIRGRRRLRCRASGQLLVAKPRGRPEGVRSVHPVMLILWAT